MKKYICVALLIPFMLSCTFGDSENKDDINTVDTKVDKEQYEKDIDSDVIIKGSDESIEDFINSFSSEISTKNFKKYFITSDQNLVLGYSVYNFPLEKEKFRKDFQEYFNKYEIIRELDQSKEVIESKLGQEYSEYAEKYIFFNEDKDYLFNLENFYNMNGVCLIIFDDIKQFTDIGGELVVPESDLGLKAQLDFYLTDLYGGLVPLDKLKSDEEYDYEVIEKLLFSYISEYLKTKETNYLKVFLETFENNLSIDYSYEVYSLYLTIQKELGKDKKYCDKFNTEYFLGS